MDYTTFLTFISTQKLTQFTCSEYVER